MSTKKIYDILYLHSPITYTVGKHMHEQGYFQNNLIVLCARNTTWPGTYTDISNMAGWGTYEACWLLQRLSYLLEDGEDVAFNLYLPHSAFHFAYVLKTSALVEGLYYLEEGDASYVDYAVMVDFEPNLKKILNESGLTKKLQLDLDRIPDSGSHLISLLEGDDPKYKASFGIAEHAFPSVSNVHVLNIETHKIFTDNQQIWLCMPCDFIRVFNTNAHIPGFSERYFQKALGTINTLSAIAQNAGGQLIIKLHPLDEAQLDKKLISQLYEYGTPYKEFILQHNHDPYIETSLFNFHKICVIGGSSASRYTKFFHSDDTLIQICLT
jgi:hypothetical protein